jgi:hypothetical protein
MKINQFPVYRRRGKFTCSSNGRTVSDDWVVSYSPFFLLRYGAHVNVEVASSLKSFKYVYKYVHLEATLKEEQELPWSNEMQRQEQV